MCINRNKEKRSKMKDVFAFIKNMGSFSVKPGPVISKENLEILKREDEEDLLEGMISDTQKQKEFVREMEKKISTQKIDESPKESTPVETLNDPFPKKDTITQRQGSKDLPEDSPKISDQIKKEKRKSAIGILFSSLDPFPKKESPTSPRVRNDSRDFSPQPREKVFDSSKKERKSSIGSLFSGIFGTKK